VFLHRFKAPFDFRSRAFDLPIQHLIDAGLLQHWERVAKREVRRDLMPLVPYEIAEPNLSIKLTLDNFGGVFISFSVWLSMPLLVFLVELSFIRFKVRKLAQ